MLRLAQGEVMSEPASGGRRLFLRALLACFVVGFLLATYGALFQGEVVAGIGPICSWLITFVTSSACGIFIVSMLRLWALLFTCALKRRKK